MCGWHYNSTVQCWGPFKHESIEWCHKRHGAHLIAGESHQTFPAEKQFNTMNEGLETPQVGGDGQGKAVGWEGTRSPYNLLNQKCLGLNETEKGTLGELLRRKKNTWQAQFRLLPRKKTVRWGGNSYSSPNHKIKLPSWYRAQSWKDSFQGTGEYSGNA